MLWRSSNGGGEEDMTEKEEVLALLKEAVETWNVDMSRETAEYAMDVGINPCEAIESGLSQGMASISSRFREGKIFLPQVMAASHAMEEAMEVIEPHISAKALTSKGVVVIGTVQGDIHEIGKHIVVAFLRGAGYKVYDLGKDVSPDEFLEEAIEKGADIVGASALMTTTLVYQRRIIERLREEKLNNIKTIFGGACCTQKWVRDIGGDAYCECGAEVVERVDQLMSEE